ncbi:hypothetical protein ScPMuIL_016417 [Solemya velum]
MVSNDSGDALHSMANTTKRYDIPIDHLDFAYLGKCSDVKELEKIYRILQSGEEGHFPELTRYCEDRLKYLHPTSRALRKDIPAKTRQELDHEEWENIDGDMKSWSSDMRDLEQTLKSNHKEKDLAEDNLPPVRTGSIVMNGKSSDMQDFQKSSKRVKPREYREWDKFDVDAELEKVEKDDDNGDDKTKVIGTKPNLSEIKRNLDSKDLTESERVVKANREKDKGNEAFKAKDYEEAVIYYSRSISLLPTAVSYNNRALTYLKLCNWSLVIDDSSCVLEMEPDNIKALLRRGSAYKEKEDLTRAKLDFDRVLHLEPENKRAEELLEQLKQKEEEGKKKRKEKGRRMVIEEVDSGGSDSETEGQSGGPESKADSVMQEHDKVSNDKSHSSPGKQGSSAGQQVLGLESSKKANNTCDKTTMGGNSDKKETDTSQDSRGDVDSENNKTTVSEEGVNSENAKDVKSLEAGGEQSQGGSESRTLASQVESESRTLSDQSTVKTESVSMDKSSAQETSDKKEEQVVTSPDMEGEKVEPSTGEIHLRPVYYQTALPTDVAKLREAGNSLFRSGQYDQAIQKYSEAISRLSKAKEDQRVNLSLLYSNTAACELKIGNCTSSLNSCTEALELIPHSLKPLLRRASAYEALERYRLAYVDYKHVLSIDSSADLAQQGATRCQQILQIDDGPKWREKLPPLRAVSHLDVPEVVMLGSMSQQPTNILPVASSTNAISYPVKMAIRESDDKDKQAPEAKELTAEEKFDKLKCEGNEHVKQGMFKKAAECYSQCISLFPDRTVSYTNRALCHLRLNQPGEAEKDCTKALGIELGNVKGLFRRAQARKMLKNYKESLEDLTVLLKLENNNSAAKKEMELVKNYWREELKTMKSQMSDKPETTKEDKKVNSKSSKQRKRIVIEEDDDEDGVMETKPISSSDKKSKEKLVQPANEKKNVPVPDKKSKDAKQETGKQKGSSKLNSAKKTVKATSTGLPVAPPSVPQLDKATPFEFIQAWNSLKSVKDVKPYAEILKQVPPENLPKVVSNKLDGTMLNVIVQCVSQHFVNSGASEYGFRILSNLCKVPRFQMVAMFMSSTDKSEVENILRSLEIQGLDFCTSKELQNLREVYGVK